MKIVGYYYLSYPDDRPVDPTCAASEMYVIVGQEGDTLEHHHGTYAFQVYTWGYVEREFIRRGHPLMERSVMLVPTLADDWMGPFLDAHADVIADLGQDQG